MQFPVWVWVRQGCCPTLPSAWIQRVLLPLLQVGQVYYWNDGSPMGNGITYNSNPYAHWGWNFLYYRHVYPSYGRYAAISGETYDNYTGILTYSALTTSSNYKTLTGRNKYGWGLVDNSSSYPVVCEVPVSRFQCPKSPPSPPPTPEGMSYCRWPPRPDCLAVELLAACCWLLAVSQWLQFTEAWTWCCMNAWACSGDW